jgi:hypothetical protein
LTTVSRSRFGFLSAVVSTAATIGVSPAAPRPRLPPAAEVGVVDLDPARRLGPLGLAPGHGPHQLVLHQPGRLSPHPEAPAELDRADPAFASREVVDGREPDRQRQLGVLEHGAGGQPNLPLAAVALEQLAGLELTGAAVAAAGAGQAFPPAHLEQRLAARLLAAEAFPELGPAQALDRAPQPVRRHPSPPPSPKPAEILSQTGMRVTGNQVCQSAPATAA